MAHTHQSNQIAQGSSLEHVTELFKEAIDSKNYLEEAVLSENAFDEIEFTLADKLVIDAVYEKYKDKYSYQKVIRLFTAGEEKGAEGENVRHFNDIEDEWIKTQLQKWDEFPLEYKYFTRFINQVFHKTYGDGNYSYSRAIHQYAEQVEHDRLNAIAAWRAYFQYRFLISIRRFLRNNMLKIKFQTKKDEKGNFIKDENGEEIKTKELDTIPSATVNYIVWSFLLNRTMPPYRTHVVPDDKPKEERRRHYKEREKAFENLRMAQLDYSFVWEITQNNIGNIFYFDIDEGHHNQMSIYEIKTDAAGKQSRGKSEFTGKCIIDATHRGGDSTDTIILYCLLSRSSEPYQKGIIINGKKYPGRADNKTEKAYQYSVIRWMIRTGVFNIRKAAYPSKPMVPGFRNLLDGIESTEKRRLLKIFENQYNRSEENGGFLFDVLTQEKEDAESTHKNDKVKYSKEDDEELDTLIEFIDEKYPTYINDRLATFELGFLKLTQDDNTIKHIYWIPILTNWKGQTTGGAVFLNTDTRVGMSDEIKIEQTTPVPQTLMTCLYYFSGLVNDKQISEIEELTLRNTETAAAVSIMSRNISHNIGSHILSYLKNILSNEDLMLAHNVFENLLIKDEKGEYQFNKEVLEDNKFNKSLFVAPYMHALADFLNYFQERQDYIGAIASNWEMYYGAVPFKDLIADYFTADKTDKSSSGKETKHNKHHNLILDFIAYSEGYKKEDIEINFNYNSSTTKTLEDLEIALPAGTTGRQAIYTILENLIRNSAKHGSAKSNRVNGKLKFDFIISDLERNENNENFYQDYFKVEIIDYSNNSSKDVVKRVEDVLESKLTKEDGSIDEHNKGVKEMQIAAAWLRDIKPYQINNSYNLKILDVEQEGNNLKYTFYLRKSRWAIVLVDSKETANRLKEQFKEKIEKGFFDIEPYNKMKNWKRAAYHFIAFHESVKDSPDYERLPVRVITNITTNDLAKHENKDTLTTYLYAQWLDKKQKDSEAYQFALVKHGKQPTTLSIGIHDGDTDINRTMEKNLNLVKIGEDGAYQSDILFRKHNDNASEFADFKKTPHYDNCYFVEGITGNNSTHRLLRNENITTYWTHKMRETALTKVLIIDERIWNNVRNKAEGDKEKLKIEYAKYAKKNIQIYSAEEDKGRFVFKDIKGDEMAILEKGLNFKNRKEFKKFHFIAIHQGLLDKMLGYSSENLKNKGSDIDRVNILFDAFKTVFKADFRYLIHSGRSKTPIIPQNTSFLQLSALDTALGDCKFTLAELLYSTINEHSK